MSQKTDSAFTMVTYGVSLAEGAEAKVGLEITMPDGVSAVVFLSVEEARHVGNGVLTHAAEVEMLNAKQVAGYERLSHAVGKKRCQRKGKVLN